MRNVAIILGVSQYKTLKPLQACKKDALLLKSIVEETGRYGSQVFTILEDEETQGQRAKARIADIFRELKTADEGYDEILFYFSGHGANEGGEFLMLFSDYSDTQVNQTSLKMSELDDMLRSIDPRVCVKIIDACHSGTDYIKNSASVPSGLEASKKSFNACYFMHSSLSSEFSWTGRPYSQFTTAFAESLSTDRPNGTKIRFKDIEDYISDDFSSRVGSKQQTPHFVHQGSLTDVFCDSSEALRKLISEALNHSSSEEPEPSESPLDNDAAGSNPVVALILAESALYRSAQEAHKIMLDVRSAIKNFQFNQTWKHIFECETHDVVLSSFPDHRKLARWLRKREGDFFVGIIDTIETYTTEKPYQRPITGGGTFAMIAGIGGRTTTTEWRKVTEERPIPESFSHTWTPPFHALHLECKPLPEFIGVPPCNLYFTFAVSRTEVALFFAEVRLKETSFDKWSIPPDIEWKVQVWPLNDDVPAQAEKALVDFQDRVLQSLTKK